MIPEYIEFIPSHYGGPKTGVFILKCGSRFYRTLINHLSKSTVNLTCYKRRSNSNPRTCPFRVIYKFRKVIDPKADGFHDPSNYVLKPGSIPNPHTCEGFLSLDEARNPHNYPRNYLSGPLNENSITFSITE